MIYPSTSMVGLALLMFALPAFAQTQLWIRQLGTSKADTCYAAATDGTAGAYFSGGTNGSLGGPNADPSGNTPDAWVARYDGTGSQLWIRQFGTSTYEHVTAAAPDTSGGVFVCGYSDGSLGGPSSGGFDAWLVHYDGAGNQSWIRRMGTSGFDLASSVAPDGSGGV
jgi:hypothetical protein